MSVFRKVVQVMNSVINSQFQIIVVTTEAAASGAEIVEEDVRERCVDDHSVYRLD